MTIAAIAMDAQRPLDGKTFMAKMIRRDGIAAQSMIPRLKNFLFGHARHVLDDLGPGENVDEPRVSRGM